jgi:hypothetical protein
MQIVFFKKDDLNEILGSADFWWALVLALALSACLLFVPIPPDQKVSVLGILVAIYITIGIGLFSVIIASYAIFTALMEAKFLIFLEEIQALDGYLWNFSFTAKLSIWTVVTALILVVIYSAKLIWTWPIWAKVIINFPSMFLVLFALFASLELTKTITGFLKRRARYYKAIDALEKKKTQTDNSEQPSP